jgi:hypothetical protein
MINAFSLHGKQGLEIIVPDLVRIFTLSLGRCNYQLTGFVFLVHFSYQLYSTNSRKNKMTTSKNAPIKSDTEIAVEAAEAYLKTRSTPGVEKISTIFVLPERQIRRWGSRLLWVYILNVGEEYEVFRAGLSMGATPETDTPFDNLEDATKCYEAMVAYYASVSEGEDAFVRMVASWAKPTQS